MKILSRPNYIEQLIEATRRSPVSAILGPRQCGKTTLAKLFLKDKRSTYFDLESQPDLRRLQNPELVLAPLDHIVVLDEIQVMPELFRVLRVLADRPDKSTRFIILGSASPNIVRNVSETLAGRVELIELSGFDVREIGFDHWKKVWLRGGFPRSYLADSEIDSSAWREGFIQTFLERDIPQLGITVPAAAMRRFWTMLAHYHGQTWNASEFARSMGLSGKTVRSYLDILTGTFMVRQLQPWYENLAKRQVKAPKIYLRDSGILHGLLAIPDEHVLLGHHRAGASWEGFALEQVMRIVQPAESYFWSTHQGAEVDLFFIRRGRRYAIEFKFTEAPKVSKSMRICLTDLSLDHLWVVYPGDYTYAMDERITAIPLQSICEIRSITADDRGSQ